MSICLSASRAEGKRIRELIGDEIDQVCGGFLRQDTCFTMTVIYDPETGEQRTETCDSDPD